MIFSKHRKFWTLVPITITLATMVGLVSYSPTLYRLFCAATGYAGTVQRGVAPVVQANGDAAAKSVTVFFDSNVGGKLPWDFHPEQRKVTVKLGQPTQVYYYAKNNSHRTIVARAVFNVTPYEVAPFFFKIQCFCFTNEKLKPGESARMPLVFYVDQQAAEDRNAKRVDQITLSYTFFEQKTLTPQEIATTRDLGTGSAETNAQLAKTAVAGFDNEAPRKQ
ncbi:cytochrome c oxidase assembly protein subunit 11 [Phyllobacterium trifolii]|uniref:Cytochrome c oxidase assembly protein CtaG n=1 Tax=Phyllobacterium trifolii TaxID=300193 RepID=A0A839UMZ2_9HYPH|nr:cytochrome c oxidase assembly protein [Phyllobacterium trifolii]MBB3149869.1 cytochrome c oxidase assembly protein subunit 11 [Phyllobacterium trifolii]